jgi:c-di-GMP-binding flagellar brake protein YcgR
MDADSACSNRRSQLCRPVVTRCRKYPLKLLINSPISMLSGCYSVRRSRQKVISGEAAVLAQWFRKQKQSDVSETSESEDALRQVYLQLFELQRTHTLIDVGVQGTEARYQSIILGVNPERREVVIDDLFPLGFYGLKGQPLKITIRQNAGRRLTFDTTIMARGQDGEVPYYTLAMPEALDGDQRRAAYRLAVGNSHVIDTLFIGPDRAERLARLMDVSADGARIEITGIDSEEFQPGNHLSDMRFDFEGVLVDCGLELCNVQPAPESRNRLLLGGKFVDISRDTQRMLERSIMQIQRDRARVVGFVDA